MLYIVAMEQPLATAIKVVRNMGDFSQCDMHRGTHTVNDLQPTEKVPQASAMPNHTALVDCFLGRGSILVSIMTTKFRFSSNECKNSS